MKESKPVKKNAVRSACNEFMTELLRALSQQGYTITPAKRKWLKQDIADNLIELLDYYKWEGE